MNLKMKFIMAGALVCNATIAQAQLTDFLDKEEAAHPGAKIPLTCFTDAVVLSAELGKINPRYSEIIKVAEKAYKDGTRIYAASGRVTFNEKAVQLTNMSSEQVRVAKNFSSDLYATFIKTLTGSVDKCLSIYPDDLKPSRR